MTAPHEPASDIESRSDVPRILRINASRGGVPKLPIDQAIVEERGITVDKQRDRRYHGGPERALCLFAIERIEALRAEGHPIAPGTIGENITTVGLDFSAMLPGVRLGLGPEVLIEITSYAAPCTTIAASFVDGAFGRISQKIHPGWSRVYAKVLTGGVIKTGDQITLFRSSPEAGAEGAMPRNTGEHLP